MGPREEKAWDEEAKIRSSPPGFGSASFGLRLQRAQLADALEEALNEWDSLRDAFVDGRFTQDDRLGIGTKDAKKIAQLRAVLAEVDRG